MVPSVVRGGGFDKLCEYGSWLVWDWLARMVPAVLFVV